MAFIKVQKLVRDDDGIIVSGSAAVIDVVYRPGEKYHSSQVVREKLGKVLYLSEDKKSGVFASPSRGLVEYDAGTDSFQEVERDDPRLPATSTEDIHPEIHTVFGDVYLLLNFMDFSGLTGVLKAVFPSKKDFERLVCHVLHGVLKDGGKISCDNFIAKSFASYLVPDITLRSLRSDTLFYTQMGTDQARLTFFRAFANFMRSRDPSFGKACYVDSTPLPNDIVDNPFNALCSHGVSSTEVMVRLVLVLDNATGMPVWYDIIPGNVLDVNTTQSIIDDVYASLGITVDSLVLDAGYVSKEMIQSIHIGVEKTFIGRMPDRKGYPFMALYRQVKPLIGKGKYEFSRNGHAYFGWKKKISLFEQEEYAYVYVDHITALTRFTKYLNEHEGEYESMKNTDKDWTTVRFGFFILLSNKDKSPKDLLTEYYGRTDIETVFKTSKEYLHILPLSKWSDQTVRGKILHDIIDTIVLLLVRKGLGDSTKSPSDIWGKTQSQMCCLDPKGTVIVETPNKQVKECYQVMGVKTTSHVKVRDFMKKLYG